MGAVLLRESLHALVRESYIRPDTASGEVDSSLKGHIYIQAARLMRGHSEAGAGLLAPYVGRSVTGQYPWHGLDPVGVPVKSLRDQLAGCIAERGMRIVVGILGVALVAALADYSWYTLHIRHSMVTGIIHGAVLLTSLGACSGFMRAAW